MPLQTSRNRVTLRSTLFRSVRINADAKARADAIGRRLSKPCIKKDNLVAAESTSTRWLWSASNYEGEFLAYTTSILATLSTNGPLSVTEKDQGWASGISHRIRDINSAAIAEGRL